MRERFRRRDKTIFFFMILLIAILLLGIGYAVLQEVFFKEEETIPTTNYDIAFINYKTKGSGTINARIDTPKKASFSVSNLEGYGDTSTIEYTIKNKEEFPLQLDITKSNITNQSYFSLTSNIDSLNHTTIKPNEEKTLIITIKVTQVSTEKEDIKANANISISANKIKEK